MSLDSPLLQCKRANPRRRAFRHRSRRLSIAFGCPTGVGGGGELRIRWPVYSFLLPRSRLGLGSGGIVSSLSSVPDGDFCLLRVGSGDGSGGFGFNGCAARCSAGGRSRSFFDRAGDVGVSSFPLFLGKRVGTWDIPVGARFVWAAELFSDGRLFFRSSIVRPAMTDLLFLSYHVKVTPIGVQRNRCAW